MGKYLNNLNHKRGRRGCKEMTLTIKDLARLLNLAPSTVSMALNNNPKINKETRKKVHELAKKLNYRPNLIARAMVRKKTQLVGLVITDIMSSFFPQVIQGIEDDISEHDYSAILCPTELEIEKENYYLNMLKQKRVDGIIADQIDTLENREIWNSIKEAKMPLVFMLTQPLLEKAIFVGVDNLRGGWLAGEHLIKAGRKRIAHLQGPQHLKISERRREGFINSLADHGLKLDKSYLVESQYTWQSGYNSMKELLKNKIIPDAVFCASDIIAIGASYAIREKGLKVPDDIAIVGFDDLFIAAIAEVPLTTIAQPKYELGKIAASKLLALMDGKKVKSEILEPKLIVRCSCGSKDSLPLNGKTISDLSV